MGAMSRTSLAGLEVDTSLARFVEEEALPGTGIVPDHLWQGLADLVAEFGPRIRAALARRDELQAAVDTFHRDGRAMGEYPAFLREIGYLLDPPDQFTLATTGVDPEVALTAGPQLVVPLSNPRFAANAANARWGSLYDALYGTDAVDEDGGRERTAAYNPVRGAEVVRRVRGLLDEHLPLDAGSHADATAYLVDDRGLLVRVGEVESRLRDPDGFVGHRGAAGGPEAVLLVHHGLHVEIVLDRDHPIGSTDAAGVADVVIESALTTIMDLEDSVAAVDAEDKVGVYRTWLQLMKGTLNAEVTKGGRTFVRTMADDRSYSGSDGQAVLLAGRSLLFVRHVGHHLFTDAVLDTEGRPIPEGVLDALVTTLAGLHDAEGRTRLSNSRTGSVYAVKPKQHGPDEVAITCGLFAAVEKLLGLPAATIKLGLMDEERRTSLNLARCIHTARDRLVFINTGFLDRTGDEIHTSMLAGPMVPKAEMKAQPWFSAYEDANVRVGLACGLGGRAQIGKGMWAAPDDMAHMLTEKVAHPRAGASCAWVPSPTAATLHALHYHQVDVAARQRELPAGVDLDPALLTIPVADDAARAAWSRADRLRELDNNLQSALGYVVRWVDAGVGCSKVPDINGTQLMEDRATCRISSQHVANWLHHDVVSLEDVDDSLRRMADVVDEQNAGDPTYTPMAPHVDGEAFTAVRDLVVGGVAEPNGYTEPVLHRHRRAVKGQAESAPSDGR